MSIAGLGLIGAGAHAVFTTSTASSQQITSGNLSVVLTAANASSGNGTSALTLTAFGPTGSSFTTGDQVVTMTNNGNIPANELTLDLTSTYQSSALASEMYVCISSTGLGVPAGDVFVFYNGPLSGVLNNSFNIMNPSDVLAPSGTDNDVFNFYAGDQVTNCGANTTLGQYTLAPAVSNAPTLDNSAENESINITDTITYNG
jgi:hypothetical protein